MLPDAYDNFDLLIIPTGDHYQARVVNSPVGQAAVDFVLPFSEQMLSSFSWLVGRVNRAVKLVDHEAKTQSPLDPKSFGKLLYESAFGDEVGKLLVRSRDQANSAGKGLRIRLRLDHDAPELAELPWEYLYVGDWSSFPALSARTPIVRYIELDQPERPLSAPLPLRILTVVSNPADAPQLQVEQEWARLQNAVADLQTDGRVVLERLAAPTLGALQDRLRAAELHILHFIGHGLFDLERNEGSLLFEDENGAGQLVSADKLATLLQDEGLHLVFLNACEGARSGPDDSFAGIATKLVQQGIPAVLAMQFAVSDGAALALAHEFYKAMADNYPVDAAVSEARKKIYVAGSGLEWGTPVLYMRTADGRIFDTGREAQAEEKSSKAATTAGWHRQGSIWLVAGLLGVAMLIGLGSLLLTDRPVIRVSITVIFGVIASLVGFLGFSADKAVGQRLTQFVGHTRPAQLGMAALLLVSLALWIGVGWPYLQAEECGPLGCAPVGMQRFAIGDWKNLTPDKPLAMVWTEGTRSVLYDKLSRVNTLQAIALDSPQVGENESQRLDWWITGDYQEIDAVQLSAEVIGQGGKHSQTVRARQVIGTQGGEMEAQILDLQDELALKILAALSISVTADLVDTIHNTPTGDPEALRLNNEAALLITQGDLKAAQKLLQEAIERDPKYASPHNNLGRILSLQGNLPGALAAYQQAATLLPRNATYPFNVGAMYERMGNDSAAIQAYEQAIALDPGYVKAFNNLGFTYLKLGDSEHARENLQRGIALAPDDPFLHKNLGRVHLEQGDAGAAVRELQRAIDLAAQLDPAAARDRLQAEAFYHVALAYQNLANPAAACGALTQYDGLATQDPSEWAAATRTLSAALQCP